MALATVEYTFPIVDDVVRGALFVDAGTVGEDLDDLDEPIRAGVGFGLRIRPAGINIPISLDFAFPVNAQDDDEKEVFSFIIGRPF